MRTLGLGLGLSVSLFLGGCGGSSSDGITGETTSSSGDAGAASSSSSSGGTTTSSSSSSGGSSGVGDAGPDSGAPKDNRIDPIEVGHSWTYNVQVIGFYPICSNGVFTSNATGSEQLDGKTAISVQSLCENAGIYKYSVDGDRVYTHVDGKWRLSFDSPVEEGHTWTDDFRSYRWESKGTVTVAAGTFDECWSATAIEDFTSYIITCRGVGPVKWHYEDGLGNGYEAVLTAKNF